MDQFGPSDRHRYQVKMWGWPRLGVCKIGLHTPKNNDDQWSIWLLMVWRFSFGGSLPKHRTTERAKRRAKG